MPILDLQHRFRELGRIRLGELIQRPGKRPIPTKLPRFRLTSQWRHLLDAAAEHYGGEVRPWEHEGRTDYELVVEVDAIPCVVPPGVEVLDQWLERWSGGGCLNRCDGFRQTIVDAPCRCPEDPIERAEQARKVDTKGRPAACTPTTRLRVMLPDVPDLGIWRLETHSYYAAIELAGAAALVETATRAGAMIPAELRLHERIVKRPNEPTKKFFVPALSFRASLGEALDALGMLEAGSVTPVVLGAQPRPALDSGGSPALPPAATSFDPAPPVEEATFGAPPAVDTPDSGPESDESEPEAVPAPTEAFEPPGPGDGDVAAPLPEPEGFEPPPPEPDRGPDNAGPTYTGPQIIAIRTKELGFVERPAKVWLVSRIVGRPVESSKDLTTEETKTVLDWLRDPPVTGDELLEDYRRSQAGPEETPSDPASGSDRPGPESEPGAPADPDDDVVEAELVDDDQAGADAFAEAEELEEAEVVEAEDAELPAEAEDRFDTMRAFEWTGREWLAYLEDRGVKPVLVAKEARELARGIGCPIPKNLDEIRSVDPSRSLPQLLAGYVEDLVELAEAES